jgi:hypothetical protein
MARRGQGLVRWQSRLLNCPLGHKLQETDIAAAAPIVKENFAVSAGTSEFLQIVLNRGRVLQWMTMRTFGMSRPMPNALTRHSNTAELRDRVRTFANWHAPLKKPNVEAIDPADEYLSVGNPE